MKNFYSVTVEDLKPPLCKFGVIILFIKKERKERERNGEGRRKTGKKRKTKKERNEGLNPTMYFRLVRTMKSPFLYVLEIKNIYYKIVRILY